MVYRDDLRAAHERINALEQELTETADQLAVAKGKRPHALVKVGSRALERGAAGSTVARQWAGAPTRLVFTHTLDGELPELAHTELVERTRQAFENIGAISSLPRSLTWTTSAQHGGAASLSSVTFTTRDGKTTIRIEEQLGTMVGGVYGSILGPLGIGGAMVLALGFVSPVLIPVAVPLWFGGLYAACRRICRKLASTRANKHETLMDDLVNIAERYIAEATSGSE